MEKFTKGFIASALIYAAVGSILGVTYFSASEGVIRLNNISIYPLMVAAVHSFLLGFFTMMIFGVTYHIIPMFAGKRFYSPLLAYIHLILSNIGVSGIIAFLLIFVYNMLLTFIKGTPGTGTPNPFGLTDKATDLVATRYTSASIIYFFI